MEQDKMVEKVISREYDYSNLVPEIENISLLVKYCDFYYNWLMKMCENDEVKNNKLKSEFTSYQYKKCSSSRIEIMIYKKDNYVATSTCKNYESFMELVNSHQLENINQVTIILDLSFRRGKEFENAVHENVFKIIFKPYAVSFSRKSNYEDEIMNQIENTIKELFGKFKVQNTIFCTK